VAERGAVRAGGRRLDVPFGEERALLSHDPPDVPEPGIGLKHEDSLPPSKSQVTSPHAFRIGDIT
jgi:hypothetical protein